MDAATWGQRALLLHGAGRGGCASSSGSSLGGGDELGLSERPVVQGEAKPRAWLLQFPAAAVSAAAAGQEASFLCADTCITHPGGLFLFSWANCRAEACRIF